ncbi:hypothetical protein [Enterococcus saccharolyticus]|uniref:hypothetical protein n=1 Tax=Enterococcus saccharolyticus TaxID=41997 RepID=UPI0039E0289A
MNIHRSQTCRNSPKNQFIEDFTIALIQNNLSKEVVAADWQLVIAGGKQIPQQIQEMTVIASISHGKYGSCTGELMVEDEVYHFSVHYEFVSTTKTIVQKAKLLFVKEIG